MRKLAITLSLIGALSFLTYFALAQPEHSRVVIVIFDPVRQQIDELAMVPPGTQYICPDEHVCIEALYDRVKSNSLEKIESDISAIVPPPTPTLVPKTDG